MVGSFFSSSNWSSNQKVGFRFLFIFFSSYMLFNPNNNLDSVNWLFYYSNQLLHKVILWFAKYFLHVKEDITIFTGGSGDTRYDYSLWIFGIVISIFGTLIWTYIDKKNKNYATLFYWLTTFVRFYLVYTMLDYGSAKFTKTQFTFPDLMSLDSKLGNAHPMSLAWNFFGYSKEYNYFMGFAEIIGGVFLMFRRTTLLGALICFMVMTNVFVLNVCYDICVKLCSFNLVLMCIFLISIHLQSFIKFFFKDKASTLPRIKFPYTNKKLLIIKSIAKSFILLILIFTPFYERIGWMKDYGDYAPKAPLYGIYKTEYFIQNKDTLPPLMTDSLRWYKMIIMNDAVVTSTDQQSIAYSLKIDTLKKYIEFVAYFDSTIIYKFNYKENEQYLYLNGVFNKDSIKVNFKRFDEKKYLLKNHKAEWITE